MALKGQAFVAMWHDFNPEYEIDYQNWHTKEHMPERLGVPGFLRGRRYINHTVSKYRYFTIYETENLEVFTSDAYLERLNNPTEWSLRTQPQFRNFLRTAAETVSTIGQGVAKQLLTVRIWRETNNVESSDNNAQTVEQEKLQQLQQKILSSDRVSGVHFGRAMNQFSNIDTAETALRGSNPPAAYDQLLLIEGVDKMALTNVLYWALPRLQEILPDAKFHSVNYELDYVLTSQ